MKEFRLIVARYITHLSGIGYTPVVKVIVAVTAVCITRAFFSVGHAWIQPFPCRVHLWLRGLRVPTLLFCDAIILTISVLHAGQVGQNRWGEWHSM